MHHKEESLVLVFNVDRFGVKAAFGRARSVFSNQYECHLWNLTHRGFLVEPKWREYLKDSGLESNMMFRDTFPDEFNVKELNFPEVFVIRDERPVLVLSKDEINNFSKVEELIDALQWKLVKKK